MSLSLSANFISKQNSVLPLAQSATKQGLAVRVASSGTDVLGTITAQGAQATPVNWSISQNPSWVTITPDSTSMILTLSFENAQAQAAPYQFYIACTDGVTTSYFPILLEVKDPFSISAASGNVTFSVPSYDASVADIVIQGFGLNGVVEAGVSFIPPLALPSGLLFVTSDESKMVLRVADSTSTDLSGGLSLYTDSPVTTQFSVQAYKPGTMYDNPDRCFTQEFTLESLTAKAGTVDVAVSVAWDTTQGAFSLNANVDFLEGRASTVTYEWDVSGTATGSITSGGTATDSTMVWTPTAAGLVQFTFKVKDGTTGEVLGQQVIAPVLTGTNIGIPCSASATWTSSQAVKISISSPVSRGFVGDQPSVSVSTVAAELATNESITVTLDVSTASNVETGITLGTTTITLDAANPSVNVPVPIPASGLNEKWILQASAANALTNPTRTGYAEAVFESNGAPVMTVATSGGTALTSNTGSSLVGVILSALTAGSVPVPNVTFSLLGAPDGLYVNAAQLSGNALEPGVYSFKVVAEAAGYTRSYSASITLTVSQVSVPLTISDAVPSVASLPDGQQYNVAWGITGTPTVLNLIQNYTLRNVLGITQASLSQVGSSVVAIYGESYYGDAYSIPAIVLSSSITALGNLLNAPTTGTLDENFNLTLKWQPFEVNGSYQVYRGFNIWLSAPQGTPILQTINGSLPTGLEVPGSTVDARLFEEVLTAGDWVVNMQALSNSLSIAGNASEWDQPHEFPTALTSASVSFDNRTVSIGQSVTISLDPNYTGADSWCAFFPDGTNTGWLPLSIRSTAKAFTTFGSMPIVIQTQRNYSSSNPGVKLNRQVTATIYVMNQQFNPGSSNSSLTGDLGLGGSSGFEVIGENSGSTSSTYQITDASNGAVALAPYEVVVRALVRDLLSNELKLMVATARTADASSLLGTMALDVFPILGRPRTKNLIDPALYLTAEQVVAGNPVKIATTALPNAIVGKAMNDFLMQVAENSGVAPFSWYVDNLPPGLRLSINGTITGAPTQLGTVTANFAVMDSNFPPFIAETTLEMTVETDLVISTTTLPPAQVGTPYNIPVVQTGGLPPYTWELVSGALPTGLTIDSETGVLVGTPVTYNSTTDFTKVYTFTVQVVDAIGAVASASLTCTLQPAVLAFGPLDQPQVFANESFRLRVPVFGGQAPYQLTSFSDDGVIGNGLAIVNPHEVAAVAGVTPPVLAVTTADQQTYPQSYPANPSFPLEATGGTAPYQFTVVPGSSTTLPGASAYGDLLTSAPTADGNYTALVQVTDSLGNTAQKTIQVLVQQKSTGTYLIQPVSVALNGSNNPSNWTVTPLAALPDAANNQPYAPAAGSYYGLALYQGGALHMTQNAGSATPMNFTLRSGALPNGIVAFSGNSFGQTGDFSGIQLFNVSGGQNATVNGSYSFEAEFSNIETAQGTVTQAVSRASITVTTAGGGVTPVVIVTTGVPVLLAADGSVDQHYTLVSSADSTAPGPNVYVASTTAYPMVGGGWAPNGPDSKWIAPLADAGTGLVPGSYTYQTTFDLTGLDPTTAELSGYWAADDSVVLKLNGVQVASTNAFTNTAPFSIKSGFITGVNTLQFVVTNAGVTNNPTGLQVEIGGTAQSPNGPAQIVVYGTGTLQAGVSGNFAVNLTTATGSPYAWFYPLMAEGGTGPYTFRILTGTTLPAASIATLNGLPALASPGSTPGIYFALIEAEDTNGVLSAPVGVAIELDQTPTEPIHIVSSNVPVYVYAGRPLPANTYYVESDLLANFSASGLPPGISLSLGSGTRGYLSGTATSTGTFTITFTATSVTYNTAATLAQPLLIRAQAVAFLNPPTSAVIGTNYRVVNNNAIVSVQYTGYQPSDANLPLPTSLTGHLGAPGTVNNGAPTTGVQSLTADGFVLSFDYENDTLGTDTLTIGTQTASVAITYPILTAAPKTTASTVSEYSTTATFAAPVSISGGKGPYEVTFTGFSDLRFTAAGSTISVNVSQFSAGSTTTCAVSMLVTDASGQSTTVVGTVQLTIRQETFITVNFIDTAWKVNVSSGTPFTSFVIPNRGQSVVVLGHAPYQYYIDSVTLPGGLSSFVQVSPTKRVLAIQFNNASTSATISDVNASLAASGSFVVPAVAPANAPIPGTYSITLALRVVDSEGLSSAQVVTLSLIIS